MCFSGNCFRLRQRRSAPTPAVVRASPQVKIMVAFKEEFPYLRTTSGQLFEFNRDWLHAASNTAMPAAATAIQENIRCPQLSRCLHHATKKMPASVRHAAAFIDQTMVIQLIG